MELVIKYIKLLHFIFRETKRPPNPSFVSCVTGLFFLDLKSELNILYLVIEEFELSYLGVKLSSNF